MRYAMNGSGFTILGETPCAEPHAGSSWSNGTGCPLTPGMLSFGYMGRVTSMGRIPTVRFGRVLSPKCQIAYEPIQMIFAEQNKNRKNT